MKEQTFAGRIPGHDGVIQFSVANQRFESIGESSIDRTGADGEGFCYAPGFVDLQVNGYAGVDFNRSQPMSEADYRKATEALWAEGCTSFMPTLITNSTKALTCRLEECRQILETSPQLAASFSGFHLEGPFISPLDGPRGAHAKQFVCEPNWEWFERVQQAADGNVALITMSPEWSNADEFIEKAVNAGVKISIGHTNASPEQIRSAADHGATLVTHFGNGVAQRLPRHPNFLWEQLACDDLVCSLIADGFHLPESVLKTAFRAKGENALLVSDATSLSGMPPCQYESHVGGNVTLTPEGRLCLTESPDLLAGSARSLRHCVEHLSRREILPLADVWQRASRAPAQYLGSLDCSGFEVGSFANFVRYKIGSDSQIEIHETWLRGELVTSRAKGKTQ